MLFVAHFVVVKLIKSNGIGLIVNNPLSRENLSKAVDPDLLDLAESLVTVGQTAPELDLAIAQIRSLDPSSEAPSIGRMNLIGGLRASGYVVSGGRGGGKIYQILGWEKKRVRVYLDLWEGLPRATHVWLNTLPSLEVKSSTKVREYLSDRYKEERLHENCFLYPYAYEGARAHGWLLEEHGYACIIFRRFYNYPQLRIFLLFGPPTWALRTAKFISPGSLKPVQIINLPPSELDLMKKFHPEGSVLGREEGVYDLKDISENPYNYISKRGRTALRARGRDTILLRNNDTESAHFVVDTWQNFNESKHRQLSITRDHIAIDSLITERIMFQGYRTVDGETYPVTHHLFEPLPNCPDTVSLMNEKSLNYSTMPGGVPGLSDFNQIESARRLTEMGFRYEQSGGLDGGGVGLEAKKRKFSCKIEKSYTFYTTFPVSEYAERYLDETD